MINKFYNKIDSLYLNLIIKKIGIKNKINSINNIRINNIATLDKAKKNEVTFFHSVKYLTLIPKIKASYIITNEKFSNFFNKKHKLLIVDNVLLSVAKLTSLFYPDALNDDFESNIMDDIQIKKFKKVKFGKNVVVGKNVKIGPNTKIGHNTIIEDNVEIGTKCSIGSNVIIKKSIIGNNVNILDGAVIGKKGFGFYPDKNKNIRYPHIGLVLIGDNVEIGCNNTIDRGSLSNTVIGNNTFLDNQVHIAHNVKIGKNSIITAQVGFAGSTTIGERVSIGGQAGISGHLKIGNNVQIGGGSGVIKNIPDNTKVMGYPAKDIRNFIKENKQSWPIS